MSEHIYLLTACRNAAETIEATFASIISQKDEYADVDFFLHYHVQDGASTDGTLNIITAWAEKFNALSWCSFTYTSEQDGGMYDAIAKGFSALENIPPDAYMGWINADDRLLKGGLAIVARIAKEYPKVCWLGGTWTTIDISGNVLEHSENQYFPQDIIRNGLCDCVFWPVLQQEGSFWKKKIWDAVGGLDTSFRLAGDWDLWRRMAHIVQYTHIDYPIGAFCRRDGQLSSTGYIDEIKSRSPESKRRSAAQRLLFSVFFSRSQMTANYLEYTDGQIILRKSQHKIFRRKLGFLLSACGLSDIVRIYNDIKIFFRKK
jgi:glycosyltransferase involved in cell wall biosynthesis